MSRIEHVKFGGTDPGVYLTLDDGRRFVVIPRAAR
jgi:hypothetical protein